MAGRQFSVTNRNWTDTVERRLQAVVQQLSFDLAHEMVAKPGSGGPSKKTASPGTPVATGFARGSWWASINGVSAGEGSVNRDALSEMSLVIANAKAGDTVYLFNNAVYIEKLEYGHSNQAPNGFVRITLAAAQPILDDVVRRVSASP